MKQRCKDWYLENYKALKNEVERNINKLKHIPCLWIGRISIIEMCMLPKAICRVNEIPIKIPMMYFTKLEEIFQKFTCNHKRPCVATVILGKKNKIGVITLPSIKLCSREYISSRLEVSLRAFSSLK